MERKYKSQFVNVGDIPDLKKIKVFNANKVIQHTIQKLEKETKVVQGLDNVQISELIRNYHSEQKLTGQLKSQVELWKERSESLRQQNRNMAKILVEKDSLLSKYLGMVSNSQTPKDQGKSNPLSYPVFTEDDIAEETSLPSVNDFTSDPKGNQPTIVEPKLTFELFKETQDELQQARHQIQELIAEKVQLVNENMQARKKLNTTLATSLAVIPEGVVQQKKENYELTEAKRELLRSENDLRSAYEEIKKLKSQITGKDVDLKRAQTLGSIVSSSDSATGVSKLLQSSSIEQASSNIGAMYGKDAQQVAEKYEKRIEEEQKLVQQLKQQIENYLKKYKNHLNDLSGMYELLRFLQRNMMSEGITIEKIREIITQKTRNLGEEKSRQVMFTLQEVENALYL